MNLDLSRYHTVFCLGFENEMTFVHLGGDVFKTLVYVE